MSAPAISLKRLLLIAAIAAAALPAIAAALQLGEGWTLTGNGRDVAVDAAEVFGTKSAPRPGISSNVISVWKWDAINQRWAFFTPSMDALELTNYAESHGYAVLAKIFPGDGFWINTSAATVLNMPAGQSFVSGESALVVGWNLLATGANVTVGQFHTSIAPVIADSIWTRNSAQSTWYFYTPVLAAESLAALIQRQGYLDFGSLILADGVGFWVNVVQRPEPHGAGLLPRVTSVNPNSLRRGATVQVQIPGNGLLGAALQAPGSDLVVADLQSSMGLLTFTLTASSAAALGPRVFVVTNTAGNANFTITVQPQATAQIEIDPAWVVLAPGGSRDVRLRLGNPDAVDHQITVSVADTTVASVSASSVLIPAGQTEVVVSVTGLSLGNTALEVRLDALAPTVAGIYVTQPFTGSDTGYSRPVGVTRTDATAPPPSLPSEFISAPIGILRPASTTGENTAVPLVSPPVGVVKIDPPIEPPGGLIPVSSVPVGVTRTDTIGGSAISVPVVSSTVGVVKIDPTVEPGSIVPVSSAPVGVTKTDVPGAAGFAGLFVSPPVGVQKQ